MCTYKWKYPPILQDHAYFRCHRLSNKNHSTSMASLPSSDWSDLPQSFAYCRFWDNVSLAQELMYHLAGYPLSFGVLSVSVSSVLRLKICNRPLNHSQLPDTATEGPHRPWDPTCRQQHLPKWEQIANPSKSIILEKFLYVLTLLLGLFRSTVQDNCTQ